MRSRTVFLTLSFILVTLSFALPIVAQAGGIPFFGPIVPSPADSGVKGSDVCAAGWGMLMVVINNLISFLLTIVIVFIAPLMIAYSGFLFVLNPVNAGGKEEAKKILTNTVVGIVIALAGWMIVDAVMAVLYNPGDARGTWTNLITTGGSDFCIPLKASLKQAEEPGVPTPGITVAPSPGLVAVTAFDCKNSSSCQVSAATNAKLNQMKTNLGTAASQYQITETGVNTTVTHASGANNLDMSCRGACSPEQVKAAIAAWPGSVKYETASQSDYDAMIKAGVPSGNILGPTWFTGTFSGGVCSTGTGHCITGTHMSLNS